MCSTFLGHVVLTAQDCQGISTSKVRPNRLCHWKESSFCLFFNAARMKSRALPSSQCPGIRLAPLGLFRILRMRKATTATSAVRVKPFDFEDFERIVIAAEFGAS